MARRDGKRGDGAAVAPLPFEACCVRVGVGTVALKPNPPPPRLPPVVEGDSKPKEEVLPLEESVEADPVFARSADARRESAGSCATPPAAEGEEKEEEEGRGAAAARRPTFPSKRAETAAASFGPDLTARKEALKLR